MNEYELAFTSELKGTPISEGRTVTNAKDAATLIELEKQFTTETILGNGDRRIFRHTDTSFKDETLSELTVVEGKKYAELSTIVSTQARGPEQETSELLMLEETTDGVYALEASFNSNNNTFMVTIKFYDKDDYLLAKQGASQVVTTYNNFKTGRMFCDMATEGELRTVYLKPSGKELTKYTPMGKEGYLEFLKHLYQKGVLGIYIELSDPMRRTRRKEEV